MGNNNLILVKMAKIFPGDSTSSSKIVFTFDGKHIYQGDSISSS